MVPDYRLADISHQITPRLRRKLQYQEYRRLLHLEIWNKGILNPVCFA
jgi:hypothetical protein